MPRNELPRVGEGFPCPRSISRPALGTIVLVLGLTLSSCGLENTVYYSQPALSNGGGSGPIILQHNTANNDGPFLGYDVYYRVFGPDDESKADTALSTIGSVQDTTTYTPATALAKLVNDTKFVRILSIDASGALYEKSPLLSVANSGVASSYTIQVPTDSSWYYTVDSNLSQKIKIVRGVSSTSTFISFNSPYVPNTDKDYASAQQASTGSRIFIVLFAIAYGFDFSSSSSSATIYSFPVGTKLSYTLPPSF